MLQMQKLPLETSEAESVFIFDEIIFAWQLKIKSRIFVVKKK
jgi:hypothetical protein